jgi:hypothetical protein
MSLPIAPDYDENGVPMCSQRRCPAYDTDRKYCTPLNMWPYAICYPAVKKMWDDAAAKPYIDPEVANSDTFTVHPASHLDANESALTGALLTGVPYVEIDSSSGEYAGRMLSADDLESVAAHLRRMK